MSSKANNNSTTASNRASRYNTRESRKNARMQLSGRPMGQRYPNLRHDVNGTPPRNQRLAAANEVKQQQGDEGLSSLLHYDKKIYTGDIGTFMKKMASFLTDEELIGEIPDATSTAFADLTCISTFLAHHTAIVTLSKASSTESNSGDNCCTTRRRTQLVKERTATATTVPIVTTVPAYWDKVIRQFSDTQMDRQAAGLRTNTNRESTEGMNQLIESHKTALMAAITHAEGGSFYGAPRSSRNADDFLSKDVLCEWHKILSNSNASNTGAQYILGGGTYRVGSARAGNTVFCHPRNIEHEMERFFSAIWELHSRWDIFSCFNATSPAINDMAGTDAQSRKLLMTYRVVALGAIYMYGITDVHPFSDGNGRISRLSCNWVLRRFLGLPFSITLAATPHQRKEYIEALRSARTAIGLIQERGTYANNYDADNRRKPAAIFQSLINLLLDRTANALQEVQRILAEKTRAASADEEDRIARLVRERAAAGSCVICLDDNPNIATLCCGHAVHLNCMAEWLSNNSTCVSCRASLPQMIKPVPPTTVPEYSSEGNTTMTLEDDDHGSTTIHDETTTSFDGFMDEDTTTIYIEEADADHVEPETETETETTTGDVEPVVITTRLRRSSCACCPNQSAMDCTNGMCGSCCLIRGYYSCSRHNGG
jgi:fido (protein-threonine AMPylation protein)